MPFPESKRVIYQKNPIYQVICQVRFPSILRIEAELPAAFQERIRGIYPRFEVRSVSTEGLPPEVASLLGQALPSGRQYEFASEDSGWKVILSSGALALTCEGRYEKWETFESHLAGPLEALRTVYQPAYLTRIGLRYIDIIRRQRLGLGEVAWSELLNHEIAGELASAEISEGEVKEIKKVILVALPDQRGDVRIRHGLAEDDEDNTIAYVIDSDFFVDRRTEINDVNENLGYFNRQAGRLFRWAIQDRLHNAMDPDDL